MAYTLSNVPTLLDLANISDADGKVTSVIEILNETNEVLAEMSWKEGNLPTGHRTTIRTGLPSPTWRKLYGFVQPTKGVTAQVTEQCGMLEAFAEVDCALADLNGNTAAFRLSEDRAHIEGMNQEMTNTIFYGDDDDAAFIGLTPRYNATSAENGDNVILGNTCLGGTAAAASNTRTANSIWLICWGDNTVQGIVPKASKAGLQVNDLGKKLIQGTHDTSTNAEASPGRMMAYVSHYRWDAGISVRDWRYAVRIANIPVSNTVAGVTVNPSFTTLPELMHQAMDRIPNMQGGRCAWYMSRLSRQVLRQSLSRLTSESSLEMMDVGGKKVQAFMGIPIRRVDQLSENEAPSGGAVVS